MFRFQSVRAGSSWRSGSKLWGKIQSDGLCLLSWTHMELEHDPRGEKGRHPKADDDRAHQVEQREQKFRLGWGTSCTWIGFQTRSSAGIECERSGKDSLGILGCERSTELGSPHGLSLRAASAALQLDAHFLQTNESLLCRPPSALLVGHSTFKAEAVGRRLVRIFLSPREMVESSLAKSQAEDAETSLATILAALAKGSLTDILHAHALFSSSSSSLLPHSSFFLSSFLPSRPSRFESTELNCRSSSSLFRIMKNFALQESVAHTLLHGNDYFKSAEWSLHALRFWGIPACMSRQIIHSPELET